MTPRTFGRNIKKINECSALVNLVNALEREIRGNYQSLLDNTRIALFRSNSEVLRKSNKEARSFLYSAKENKESDEAQDITQLQQRVVNLRGQLESVNEQLNFAIAEAAAGLDNG